MNQYVKMFNSYTKKLDDIINDYLEEHPNYIIDKIAFAGQAMDKNDRVLIVFKET